MRNLNKLKIFLIMIVLFVSGCSLNITQEVSDKERYSFFQGDNESKYYLLDMNDQKLLVVKGRPFMVLEYDSSGIPIRCEFGLSYAENIYLKGASGAFPEPFMSSEILRYAKKLDLKDPIDILCNFCSITSYAIIDNYSYEFWIDKGENSFGHEILHFIVNSTQIQGEIINEEVTWGGRVSDEMAFKLVKKFEDNNLN